MKKIICMLLALSMVFALAACAQKPAEETEPEPEMTEWTRQGYFQDESGESLFYVFWMEDTDAPGWYAGVMMGELMAGGTVALEGNALKGEISTWEEGAEPIPLTITEEGEDGVQVVMNGETYHFTPMETEAATIFVTINTEGWGMIGYEEGETAPELDPEMPYQSAQVNLAEAATYTLAAAPQNGSIFVKWTKNGEDFSTEAVITVLLDESADFVAVFEEDPDWQNPVMNYVGVYQCDRARATVESSGYEDAWITIDWSDSAGQATQWLIFGTLNAETLTLEYTGSPKYILTYDENGEVVDQAEEYEDGTGTVVFGDDGTFTWHDDMSESGTDMVFEFVPAE